ncbi:MAG: sulfurtransferase TusA family protein [Candidatus Glassbacteria bacterium]|nr:sulfurtransferase TusA family protein [Candidatus Glassbacteria bacterium]
MNKPAGQTLDLRGTPCPMNFVRIKLELDRLGAGKDLAVTADGGDTGRDILRSLREQGFVVRNVREHEKWIEFAVSNSHG